MITNRILHAALAMLLCVLAWPATVSAQGTPASCQALLASAPGTLDGTYPISVNGTVVNLYCAGMASGSPKEYINLLRKGTFPSRPRRLARAMFRRTRSTIRVGRRMGRSVTSSPSSPRSGSTSPTMRVITTDFAFATRQSEDGTGFFAPYANVEACGGGISSFGNIDLTGTAFKVADTFWWYEVGYADYSLGDQVVDLGVGGGCG